MYTSMLVFALSGLAASADVQSVPSWLTDYAAATKQAAGENKPLAVFLGAGESGWAKLSAEGELPSAAKEILASNYVCLHVDTGTDEGKQLAEQFRMPKGVGIVISDRAGQLQAFRHEGELPERNLVSYLERFADPNLVVRTTQTNPSERTSNYGPTSCPTCAGGRCWR